MTTAVVAAAHGPFQRILCRSGYAPSRNDRPDGSKTINTNDGDDNRRASKDIAPQSREELGGWVAREDREV